MLLKLHKLIKWVGLIVCVLVSLLAGRRMKKIDMVESLKSAE